MQSSATNPSSALLESLLKKCYELYLFDFDYTLTQEDSEDIDEDNIEELTNNIKPGIAEAFRAIWASSNALAILTRNSDNDLITKHLAAAGLSSEEIKKIPIKNKNSMPTGSTKPDWVISALKEHPSAEAAYYYDDENEFLEAAKLKLLEEQSAGTCVGRKLICIEIPLEAKYAEHLTGITHKLRNHTNSNTTSHYNFFTTETRQNTPDVSNNTLASDTASITPTLNLDAPRRMSHEN